MPRLASLSAAVFDATWDDALQYRQLQLTKPRRRAEYLAAPDPTGARAQTFKRLQAACRTYERLRRRGYPPPPKAAPSPAPAPRDPPWLRLLDARERAEFEAARADAAEHKKRGLANRQRRDAYRAAAAGGDVAGQHAQTVERLRAA
jgi:hypothetical protein